MRGAVILLSLIALGVGAWFAVGATSSSSDKETKPAADKISKPAEVSPQYERPDRPRLPELQPMPAPRRFGGDGVRPERQERQMRRQERRAQLMERFDANGDGVLDDDERAALRAGRRELRRERNLEFFDSDGDGELDEDEQATRELARDQRMAERAGRMVEAIDTDADGMISRAEAEGGGGRMQRILSAFDEVDTNGDQMISEQEMQQALTDRRRERRERRRRFDDTTD